MRLSWAVMSERAGLLADFCRRSLGLDFQYPKTPTVGSERPVRICERPVRSAVAGRISDMVVASARTARPGTCGNHPAPTTCPTRDGTVIGSGSLASGSTDPENPLLLDPIVGKRPGQPGDRRPGGSTVVSDRSNDLRSYERERRKQANMAFHLAFPLRDGRE